MDGDWGCSSAQLINRERERTINRTPSTISFPCNSICNNNIKYIHLQFIESSHRSDDAKAVEASAQNGEFDLRAGCARDKRSINFIGIAPVRAAFHLREFVPYCSRSNGSKHQRLNENAFEWMGGTMLFALHAVFIMPCSFFVSNVLLLRDVPFARRNSFIRNRTCRRLSTTESNICFHFMIS